MNKAVVILSALLLTSCSNEHYLSDVTNKCEIEIESVIKNAYDNNEIIINYSVNPGNANVLTELKFAPDDSSSLDNDSWKLDKNVNDYIEVTKINNDSIKIHCIKPFASQIILNLSAESKRSVSKDIIIDCDNRNLNYLYNLNTLSNAITIKSYLDSSSYFNQSVITGIDIEGDLNKLELNICDSSIGSISNYFENYIKVDSLLVNNDTLLIDEISDENFINNYGDYFNETAIGDLLTIVINDSISNLASKNAINWYKSIFKNSTKVNEVNLSNIEEILNNLFEQLNNINFNTYNYEFIIGKYNFNELLNNNIEPVNLNFIFDIYGGSL